MASIRSFLVYLTPGSCARVATALRHEPGCEVFPSENADLLVVVTDHESRADEDRFDDRLASLEGVASVAFVSGYLDDAGSQER